MSGERAAGDLAVFEYSADLQRPSGRLLQALLAPLGPAQFLQVFAVAGGRRGGLEHRIAWRWRRLYRELGSAFAGRPHGVFTSWSDLERNGGSEDRFPGSL
ncbi:hypothetical protein AB0F17_51780 [Nonomuraea sp. NPDC026600]|uniref:hypothetical protein n=1 Tax=Nonomuraea sp. NPDC026600 TaxID=3155363 RepID=UPI0033D75B5E